MSRVYDALRKGQDEIFHVVLPPPVNEAAVPAEPAVPKTAAVSQAAEPVPTISHFVTRNAPPKTAPNRILPLLNQHFGLHTNPFNLTPDPEFLYLTPQYREALAGLTYAIMGRKGFAVLIGNTGTGKTTLLARVLQHLPVTRIQSSLIVNPTLTTSEFLEAALLDFGLRYVPSSKAQRMATLRALLLKGRQEGKVSALIVDEAHKLSLDLLEEIRLLGNFDYGGEKLLQIVLIGQGELDNLLGREDLRQFKQRVAVRLSIEPCAEPDVEQYIRYRWTKAGGAELLPFSAEVIHRIAQASQGIPRVINLICDTALMQAFGEGSVSVHIRHVAAACKDLRLFEPSLRPNTPVVAPLSASTPAYLPSPISALERYSAPNGKPSLLTRFACKLGLGHKVETA